MDDRAVLAIVVTAVTTLLAGLAAYFLVWNDPFMTIALAVLYGAGSGLSVMFPLVFRGAGDEGRPRPLWSGAFGGLLMFAVVFGAGPALSLPSDQRFALGLLIIGVGWVSVTLGVAMAKSAAERAGTTPAEAGEIPENKPDDGA